MRRQLAGFKFGGETFGLTLAVARAQEKPNYACVDPCRPLPFPRPNLRRDTSDVPWLLAMLYGVNNMYLPI